MKQITHYFAVTLFVSMTMLVAGCGKDDAESDNVTDEWVDLGLPSGLLWAKCNVGASSPEDYGDYFAWGETQAKSNYSWETYRYANGDYYQLTKYCYNKYYGYNEFTDNLTTLTDDDDAAAANVTGSRMPTRDDWKELLNNTTSQWTTINDINGRIFTGPNGKTIFLPAAGGRWGDEFSDVGSSGGYWSSSLSDDRPDHAGGFGFSSDDMIHGISDRNIGYPVRPVRSSH